MAELNTLLNQELQNRGISAPSVQPNLTDILKQELKARELTHKKSAYQTELSFNERFLNTLRHKKLLGETEELGEPDLSYSDRGYITMMGDTFKEKQSAFKRMYPKGIFSEIQVPGKTAFDKPTTMNLFKRNPEDKLSVVDPNYFEIGDIAEFMGEEAPSIAGEAVGLALPFGRGKTIFEAGKALLGGTAGEQIRQGIQSLAGTQQEPAAEAFYKRPFGKGVAAGIGGIAAAVPVRGARALKGAGVLEVVPGGRRAMQAAQRQGVPQFLPVQIAQSPLWKRMGQQAATVVTSFSQYFNEQEKAIAHTLSNLRVPAKRSLLLYDLKSMYEGTKASLLRKIKNPNINVSQASEDFQKSITDYEYISQVAITKQYAKAANKQQPIFSKDLLDNTIQEITLGAPIQTVPTAQRTTMMRAEGELHPEVQNVINDIVNMDFTQPGITIDNKFHPTWQGLQSLRHRLYELKTPGPNELYGQKHRDANKLYNAIKTTIENPRNTATGFVSAWKQANNMAKDRFDTMGKLLNWRVASDAKPSEFVTVLKSFEGTDESRNIKFIKETLNSRRETKGKWRLITDSYKSDLLLDGDNLTKRLNTIDSNTQLELLGADLNKIKKIGERIDDLNSIGIQDALRKQTEFKDVTNNIILQNNPVSTRNLYLESSKKQRESFRIGIIDNIIDNVIVRERGVNRVDKLKLNNYLKLVQESGAIRFLKRNDIKILLDVDIMQSIARLRPDAGTSIQAAETAAGLRTLSDSAINTLLEHIGMARLMTTVAGRALLIGTSKGRALSEKTDYIIRLTSSALASSLHDLEEK